MRRKKYRFSDKNQSRLGLISSGIGAVALMILLGVLVSAYQQYGQAGKSAAVLGILAFILALVGMYYGLLGTKEQDTYMLFPWMGCGMNGVVLLSVVLSYLIGW